LILLTGSTGFIGSAISRYLLGDMIAFKGVSRHERKIIENEKVHYAFQINDDTNWLEALNDVDVVVHVAGKAHVMKSINNESLAEYKSLNVDGTLSLARQCAENGVKRFIFISTINVNGAFTVKPFTAGDDPDPIDTFAQFKWKAEKALWNIQQATGMEVIIIRSPLVYGPSVKGNFASIIQLIKKGIPLPLGCTTKNKRSFIALENLVDFILLCADYNKTPQAANQTFVISDGEDVSTAELFHRVAKGYGKKSRLFPFPVFLLRLGAKLLGKQDMADRLLGSLQVDSAKARDLLGWQPVITMDEQLRKMAKIEGCSRLRE